MRKFKKRQRYSVPFGLFLAVMGALLLPAAVAPRANAGSTGYWDSEYPVGSASETAQGALINQPLASNYNPNLALNVASGAQPGAFQPLVVEALRPWTGAVSTTWATAGNWTGGTPGAADTAEFNQAFTNQPNLTASTTVGSLLMTTGVAQNVTISDSGAFVLTINGVGGTGIQIDNTVGTNTLTISADLLVGAAQAWTNNSTNSGNSFTVSGGIALNGLALTVNGTGNTLISGIVSGMGGGSDLIKDGSGTLTLTAANTYEGGTTVSGGMLLVNNTSGSGTGTAAVGVTGSGTTLGGTGIISGSVVVAAGANIAPGNGGNNTAILQTGALTLSPSATFRVDINGTTAGTGYDRIQVNAGGVNILNSVLVVTVGTTLSVGQPFTILDKVSGGNVTGTFAGIPQGGTVVGSDGTIFTVSYTGGTGNDIVLTVQALVPEPSTWMGGALAIAGLVFMQRRRLRKLLAFSR